MASDLNILIADDSKTICSMLTQALNSVGYNNIVSVSNGKEALDLLLQSQVDLIISDWNMPVCNGLDLLKSLRQSDSYNISPLSC